MDISDLAPRLTRAAGRVGPEVDRTVQQQARLVRAMIRANASGRPGPNIITGRYYDSWAVEPFPVLDGGGADIGTRQPYGRRLEYGFYDMTDSLGRHFYQRPLPHVEPAVNDLADDYPDAFRAACDRIFRS